MSVATAPTRPATETLKAEHRGILLVVEVLERACDAIEAGRPVPRDLIPQCVDFFRNFADRCHHHKEEEHLFPLLAARGVPRDGGPIGVMLHEHTVGRSYLSALEQAAASGDRAAILRAGRGYARLLREHIHKEDHVLFPMGDRAFSPEDQAALTRAFDEVERLEMGEGTHERYHDLIHELVAVGREL
jgi:hemerythrin-like domain-containing protein